MAGNLKTENQCRLVDEIMRRRKNSGSWIDYDLNCSCMFSATKYMPTRLTQHKRRPGSFSVSEALSLGRDSPAKAASSQSFVYPDSMLIGIVQCFKWVGH